WHEPTSPGAAVPDPFAAVSDQGARGGAGGGVELRASRHAGIRFSTVADQQHHCISAVDSGKMTPMIKDIIVNLSVVGKPTAAEFAASIAKTFQAQLVGVAFNYEAAVPGAFADGMSVEFIEQQQAESLKAAQAASKSFEDAARRAGAASA